MRSIDGIVKLDDVSFTANSGEILGIAGISGCGQKELLEAIAGLQPTENGSICYVEDDGTREELLGKDPLRIAEMGVALSFVPEDRLGMGLVGNMDLSDNMMLRSFRKGRGMPHRPQVAAQARRDRRRGARRQHPGRDHAGAPPERRQCAEGARRPRDRL